jgi:hypothetical protein
MTQGYVKLNRKAKSLCDSKKTNRSPDLRGSSIHFPDWLFNHTGYKESWVKDTTHGTHPFVSKGKARVFTKERK